MARQPAKRRRVAPAQDLDVEGDEDWQSDEISSLPATDDDGSSGSGSGSDSDSGSNSGSDDEQNEDDDDEDDVIDMLKDTEPAKPKAKGKAKDSATVKPEVEVVIPVANGDGVAEPVKRKRGRPRKEPKEPEVKVPKKRGRPRKYAEGEKRPRRSRRKLNPDGSFKKRGRPKKVVDPDAVMMKVPKRRGRPPKQVEEGQEGSKPRKRTAADAKRKPKREFDLLAGLDLDLELDGPSAGIIPGVGRDDDDDEWLDEAESPRKQDDILAKLRRRIMYRQQDAELQDFIDNLGPDGEPISSSHTHAGTTAAAEGTEGQEVELLNGGDRSGLPVPKSFQGEGEASAVPSSEKRKERQPFEPALQTDSPANEAMSALAEAAATAAAESEEQQARQPKPKGRPPGSKNRRPDYENHPLFLAARPSTHENGTSLSLYPTGSGSGGAGGSTSNSLIKPTSSDAYFLFNTSKRARGLAGMGIGTSASLISTKLRALEARRLAPVVEVQTREGTMADVASRMYRRLLPVYFAQLLAGYAIIFHGVGAKTPLLTELVSRRIEAHGDAIGVVAQGAIKGFKVEDLLAEIESALSLGPLSGASLAVDADHDGGAMVVSTLTAARAERIVRRFSGAERGTGPSRLFLILETFDAPGMQSLRFKSVLEILAHSTHIHIMATTEHVNSGFIASSAQQAAASEGREERKSGRLCWIWQNMSTFVPSLDEMLMMRSNPAFATWMPVLPAALDLIGSSASYAAAGGSAPGTGGAQEGQGAGTAYFNGLQVSDAFRTVSEASAISILKSVTTKARALFNLLAKQTLSNRSAEANGGSVGSVGGVGGVAYAELLNRAKRSFLVSNEADFKSLLIEFKDHHLCHISKQGLISIGLPDASVLANVLDKLKSI